jgi:hypothetical protein
MKKITLVFSVLICSLTFAQDPQLFDIFWYLEYVKIIEVATYPPSNAEISNVLIAFDNSTTLFLNVCREGAGIIEEINDTTYTIEEYVFLITGCGIPETLAFEEIYF